MSSNDGIAKTVPEIRGIYSLENNLYNDKVVYVHKDIGFELKFNYSTNLQNQLHPGAWGIYNGTHLLSYNTNCEDTDISTDGKCDLVGPILAMMDSANIRWIHQRQLFVLSLVLW